MAVKIEVPYSKVFPSAKDISSTFQYLSELEKSIPANFVGLESFQTVEPNVYHWRFHKFEHSGYGFQVEFFTKVDRVDGKSLSLSPVAKPGITASLNATWNLNPASPGTTVNFQAKLELDLPLPFFLKSVAGPLAQKELSKLFDKYTHNVGKALS